MKRIILSLLLLILVLTLKPTTSLATEMTVPRVIIALYDKKDEEGVQFSRIHKMAEMPLNHLGLTVEYYDINENLPDIKNREDVRGLISWFVPGTTMKDPEEYINWAISAIDAGKKMVIMGDPGFDENKQNQPTSTLSINRLLNKLGIEYGDEWVGLTYDIVYTHKNPDMVEYERKYAGFHVPYIQTSIIDKQATSHLIAHKEDGMIKDSDLVVTGPNGGYIAEDYEHFYKGEEKVETDEYIEIKQWYVNPFEFFRLSFYTDDLPKPDVTTLTGRRIYYSHIDGDGWNNLTQIEQYRRQRRKVLSAEVIMDHVIKPYPDLPVTIAPIAADIDPEWFGKESSLTIARELFTLPQVELGSHTYSHPFFWKFFESGDPEVERPYLKRYKGGSWGANQLQGWFSQLFSSQKEETKHYEGMPNDYFVPRAFAKEPFSIEKEILGSKQAIEQLAPDGKQVKILMWSGDTSPFEKAVELTRTANIQNINGGDSRFDREYPSVSWVSPIGRPVGRERQIYASNSNENTYTDLWSGRFYGFKYLLITIKNTETPIRLKPFNIYYHMYSGEKEASLNALLANLNYARSQNITPITASQYAEICQNFYDIQLLKIGVDRWKIQNADELQTIRFDKSTFKTVDFNQSKGVIGQTYFHGSLYIHLDSNIENPIIALKPNRQFYKSTNAPMAYLIESRWNIWGLERNGNQFNFKAKGFGNGEMKWKVPTNGKYVVYLNNEPVGEYVTEQNKLTFTIERMDNTIKSIKVIKI